MLKGTRNPFYTLEERFWKKVSKGDGCWDWTGAKCSKGYGRIGVFDQVKNKYITAISTRVSWFIKHGVWPVLFICHKCDNPKCVRPDHLFEGTHSENMQDATRKGRNTGKKIWTHCKRGHPFSGDNLYLHAGKRRCRACRRAAHEKRRDQFQN